MGSSSTLLARANDAVHPSLTDPEPDFIAFSRSYVLHGTTEAG